MKPKYPLTAPFEKLPEELPIYPLENALLPGGELPLTFSEPAELSMFLSALKTDQLIGMIQPNEHGTDQDIYPIGCAGRVRQYRERKDGNINIMLTGVCRYKIVKELPMKEGYRRVVADWSDFQHDYETDDVEPHKIDIFKTKLQNYFDRHRMQVDWEALNKAHIEEVVNNLVLVLNLSVKSKQLLLEAPNVENRMELFIKLLEEKQAPIWTGEQKATRFN